MIKTDSLKRQQQKNNYRAVKRPVNTGGLRKMENYKQEFIDFMVEAVCLNLATSH